MRVKHMLAQKHNIRGGSTMYSHSISRKNFLYAVKDAINAPVRRFNALLLGMFSTLLVMQPTMCVNFKTNLSMDSLMGGMGEIIIQIALYIGIFIIVSGVLQLLLAYKDDNAEGQTRAIRLLVIGIALVGFRVLLRTAGIIS